MTASDHAVKLNPQQFEQPMLGNMREDYPLMPEGGTTSGDELQPLYRMMRLPAVDAGSDEETVSGYLDTMRRGGGDYGRGVGLHWSHDLLGEYDVNEGRPESGYQTVALEVDHPGRSAAMDWENPEDRKVLQSTVVDYDFRELSIPEVPLRPGTSLNPRAIHVWDSDNEEYGRRIAFDAGREFRA